MATYNVGANIGGIVGGKNNTVNNFSSGQRDELASLLSEIQFAINHMGISQEQKENAKDCIDVIAEEASQSKPKKSIIKIAFDNLKKILTDNGFLTLIEKLTPIITALVK